MITTIKRLDGGMERTWRIKHRVSGKTIFSFKCKSFSLCLEIGAALKKDLRSANLRSANLRSANLSYANLSYANLSYADLSYADIDFSSLPLWCGSLNANYDDKQTTQILYHLLSVAKNSNNVSDGLRSKLMKSDLIKQANRFHRVGEVPKL